MFIHANASAASCQNKIIMPARMWPSSPCTDAGFSGMKLDKLANECDHTRTIRMNKTLIHLLQYKFFTCYKNIPCKINEMFRWSFRIFDKWLPRVSILDSLLVRLQSSPNKFVFFEGTTRATALPIKIPYSILHSWRSYVVDDTSVLSISLGYLFHTLFCFFFIIII